MKDEVLVDVIRGDVLESQHRGSLVILDRLGEPVVSLGETDVPMFPRSSSKPLQATALVAAGLVCDPQLLALVAASHSGGPEHVAGTQALLEQYGRSVADLQCTPRMPIGNPERRAYVRVGGEPSHVTSDCSGKHAGFIATCVINDWPVDSYLQPEHPVQRACLATVEELSGELVSSVSVDGCGAPLFAFSLRGLGTAFRRIAAAAADTAAGQVATAMREYPEMVGGSGRDVTLAMRQVPGLIAKDGAEAVFAMALPDGRAMALKISDGGKRAVAPVVAAVLAAWGLPVQLDVAEILGGGRRVGLVAHSAQLDSALSPVR